MKTRTLGKSGLVVSEIGFGCMGLNHGYGKALADKDAVNLIACARDLGVTFFDTAECYGPYINETVVGEALKGHRSSVVIATKCGIRMTQNAELVTDAREPSIRASLEGSLKRLQTDFIDLYYLHRVDPNVPIEEVAGTMSRLIEEGKIRAWGLSEAGPVTIERAQKVCPLTALQSEYSMMWREPESKVMPTLKRHNIALVAFSPLGKGFLTAAITAESRFEDRDFRRIVPRFTSQNRLANQPLVELVCDIAQTKRCTPAQVALAWVLARGNSIVPIPGTKHLDRLKENLGAANIVFTKEEIEAINRRLEATPIAGDRYPASHAQRVAP